ncbi:hypothetical protein [Tardiphaga sp. OK245]|uniref:hypothetical protein n=1 Tax=Tardiphaga sp. OK245 TaxID=1855306 RepID=UPI0008A805FD|nr:hypothetical protein [Tardiphaga sp. OK245]SEH87662.1 hypothetical protein SAMN05216367_2487 [Tardiphaga sp. OK245]
MITFIFTLTPDYRTELLDWMRCHPDATAPVASKWLFERFALDVPPVTASLCRAQRAGIRARPPPQGTK